MDDTEQYLSAQKNRQREELLNTLYDSIQDAVFVVDRDYNVLRTNRAMDELYSDHFPLTGKKCHVTSNSDFVCINCPVEETLRTHQTASAVHFEQPVANKPGVWLEHFTYPILVPGTEEIDGIVCVLRDISERKRAEEKLEQYRAALERTIENRTHQLRKSEARLKTILQTNAAAIVFFDRNRKITYCNTAFEELLGSPPGGLIGKLTDELILLDDPASQEYRVLRDQLFDDAIDRMQATLRIRNLKGRDVWVDTSVTKFRTDDPEEMQFVGVLLDITERHRLHDELRTAKETVEGQSALIRKNEKRLQTILQTNTAAIVFFDMDRNITYCNTAFEQFLGFKQEELLGRQMTELIDLEAAASREYLRLREDVFSGRIDRLRTNLKYKRKDGTGAWADISLTVFRADVPEESQYIVIAFDTTVRHRLARELQTVHETVEVQEKRLLASEQVFKTVFDLNGVPILFFDMNRKITYCNEAVSEFFGYSREELIGMDTRDLLARDDPRYEAYSRFRDSIVAEKRNRLRYDLKHRKKDGSTVWSDTSLTFFYGDTPENSWGAAIIFDSTERHRLFDELHKSEAKLRTVLQSNSAGIAFIDEDSWITYCNTAMELLFGYTAQELTRMRTVDLIDFSDPSSKEYRKLRDLVFSGKQDSIRFQVKHRKKDGTPIWLDKSVTAFQAEGSDERQYVAILLDVTDRFLLIEELEAAKEAAESGSRAKDQFIATMSHELRTPLNGIIGLSDLLLDSELAPKPREYAKMIKISGRTLKFVMNDILDFSGILTKKIILRNEPFDFYEAVVSAFEASAAHAHAKNLELCITFGPKVPRLLIGDEIRLRQILHPMIDNGIKYTDIGGVRMNIAFERIEGSKLFLRFTVVDTGIGMTPDQLERVFEPFYRADSSFSRQRGGTGLGLPIVKNIVELFGGSIGVQSEGPNCGSVFTAIIPFGFDAAEWENDTESLPRLESPPPRFSGNVPFKDLSVLVVDDNVVQREMLRDQIRKWGSRLTICVSKREALAALLLAVDEGRPYDLAVIDSSLEDGPGSELVEAIETQPRLQLGMILLIPATDNISERFDDLKLPVAVNLFCVRKPVYASAFFEAAVAALLPGRKKGPIELSSQETFGDGGPHGRILIVEDNRINQIVVAEILDRAGYGYAIAKNGIEACKKYNEESFDLILMDCQMPEMDGFEATENIRLMEANTKDARRTPIVALTANTSQEDEDRCLAAGMDAFCSKPVDAKQLLDYIARWIVPTT